MTMRTVELKHANGSISAVFPSTSDIRHLMVGDSVESCFGSPAIITEIFGSGINISGNDFVCIYSRSDSGLTTSDSFVANEIHRSVRISNHFTSAQVNTAERSARSAA